jgi:hypothetical protein
MATAMDHMVTGSMQVTRITLMGRGDIPMVTGTIRMAALGSGLVMLVVSVDSTAVADSTTGDSKRVFELRGGLDGPPFYFQGFMSDSGQKIGWRRC